VGQLSSRRYGGCLVFTLTRIFSLGLALLDRGLDPYAAAGRA
jgi:hypothetical protein